MSDREDSPRYPTAEEFWERLEARGVEDDLREALAARAGTLDGPVSRCGAKATVEAVAAAVLPGAVPPGVLAAFLDERFDQQLGRADEREGVMPRAELIPAGFAELDKHAAESGAGSFAELENPQQSELLRQAESGALAGPDGFDSAEWFDRVRGLLLLAYGSDPRGMVEMGFPGPSYKPGYTWLSEGETDARVARKPGYQTL